MPGYRDIGSIAGLFRQANFKQRAPLQIERISQAENPVQALLGEERLYSEACVKLRELVAPRVFHAVPAILDGRVSESDFTTALKVLLRIDFWDDPAVMSRAVLGRRSEADVLQSILSGPEHISGEILRTIAQQEKPFLSPDESTSLLLMGAYTLAFMEGSVQALGEFPPAYAHAVRTTVFVEPLAGRSLVSGMYPLVESHEDIMDEASSLGIADHARPLFENARRAEGDNNIHLWVPRWSRYFEMSGLSHGVGVLLNRHRGFVERFVPEVWDGYYYAGETFKDEQSLGDARLEYGKALLRLQFDALNDLSREELATNRRNRIDMIGELCAIPVRFDNPPWAKERPASSD